MVKGTSYAMYYDLGVYGIPKQILDGKPFSTVKSMREMEAFTRKVGVTVVSFVLFLSTRHLCHRHTEP